MKEGYFLSVYLHVIWPTSENSEYANMLLDWNVILKIVKYFVSKGLGLGTLK